MVDDEPDFSEWFCSLLNKSKDFEVLGCAYSGQEAIYLITSMKPDVVIADIYMPEPDGLEVARYVQRNFPGIKAIVVSAYRERVYDTLAREEGALAFIPKTNLSLTALRQALQEEEQP